MEYNTQHDEFETIPVDGTVQLQLVADDGRQLQPAEVCLLVNPALRPPNNFLGSQTIVERSEAGSAATTIST